MPADPLPQPPALYLEPGVNPFLVGTAPVVAPQPLRRGQVGPGWRVTTVCAWVGIALGFGAVWRTSWTIGLSTWWLGPEASPRIVLLLVLPFLAPILMVTAALRRVPWLPVIGLGSTAVTALIAWGDVDRVPGLASVEFALAAGALLVSVGSFAGLPRPVHSAPTDR